MSSTPIQDENTVTIHFEEKAIQVPKDTSVAAALLGYAHLEYTTIHPLAHDHRAPYCMMGTCHECLMEIDGVKHTQSCMTTVKEGMQVRYDSPVNEETFE